MRPLIFILAGLLTGDTINSTSASYSITYTGAGVACTGNSCAITVPSASGGGVPAGAILLIDSGACPTGYTEVAALSGKFPLGTTNGAANVGTTGGADNVTPAGTNSVPAFTGAALATHQHELPFQKVAGGTAVLRMLASSVFGTGTSRAAESQSAAPSANTTSAAVLKDQAVSAGTPSGTVTAPTFTGTQFDNRPAFERVIFCKKD